MVERVEQRTSGARRWIAAAVVSVVAVTGLAAASSGQASAEAFPGTNGKIAFAQARADEMATDLWTMDPDGSNQVQLTDSETESDSGPQWSPDGTRITFERYGEEDGQVWVIDADGTDETQLTDLDGGAWGATWSPDGTQIAFSAFPDGNGTIYVMNADGSGQAPLVSGANDDVFPSWSPDGTKIAFTRSNTGTGADQIWVVDADGSNQTQLTDSDVYGLQSYTPSWSPDGTQIFFVHYIEGEGEYGYIMNADGTDPHEVSDTTTSVGRWSPDGQLIALSYNSGDASEAGIWTVRPDGTDLQPLLMGSVWDPAWQSVTAPVNPTTTTTTPATSTTTTRAVAAVTPRFAG